MLCCGSIQDAGFSKNHGFRGVVHPEDKKGRKTRRRLKPSEVNRAEAQRATAAKCPKSLEWSSLVVLLTFFATVGTLASFYGSRTMRSIKFQQYQRRQRTFAKIVQDFAPDPTTIVVWGANFFGMRSRKDGKEFGRVPARALRRQFAKTRRVVLVNEYHTSKRSHCCGKEVKYNAATRVVTCSQCKVELDRDLNSAINMRRVWTQHLTNGMRPAGLEIPASSPWAKLETVISRTAFWSQLGK